MRSRKEHGNERDGPKLQEDTEEGRKFCHCCSLAFRLFNGKLATSKTENLGFKMRPAYNKVPFHSSLMTKEYFVHSKQ